MFAAAPFEANRQQTPFYQAPTAKKGKISLEDIIDALQSAQVSLAKAKNATNEQKSSNELGKVIDLTQGTQAYVVAERVFANGKVYKMASALFASVKEAKSELTAREREARRTAVDPESVTFEVLRVKVQGPLDAESDFSDNEEDGYVDSCHERRKPTLTSLLSGHMPIGADVLDSRLPEEEDKKFRESFNHFDDEVPSSVDVDRWFAAPTPDREHKTTRREDV